MAVEIDGVRYSWNAPLCELDWNRMNPDREPVRVVTEDRPGRVCGVCGVVTTSGIFVRLDPRTIRYPERDDD